MRVSLAEDRGIAPRQRDALVPRPRLSALLTAGDETRIGLVVAPSGYGKTTFLRQWTQTAPYPCAWLTLRPEHSAAVRLLADADVSGRHRAAGAPVALVLDRAETLPTSSAEVLLTIAERLPTGSLLVLASAAEPPLPVGRLRLERRVCEVGPHDLAMTAMEGQLLLQREGVTLDADQLAALMEATEGWPAGLALAALAMRDTVGHPAAAERFSGEDRVVADYLRDVFLAGLPEDAHRMLMRTAVLDELSGPLCDAVVGTQGSGTVLRNLARRNLLIEAVDREELVFRLHPLLRDLLRADLRRAGGVLERRSHRAAARWLQAGGDAERAAAHAAAAGDVRRAGLMLWEHAPSAALQGRPTGVDRVLACLTPAQVAGEPGLAFARAVDGLARGDRDGAAHWTGVGERALAHLAADEAARFAAGLAVLRAAVAHDGLDRMGADARQGAALADAGAWRVLACFLDGAARQLTGAGDQARDALTEGARIGALGAPVAELLCEGQLALLHLLAEAWDDAAEHAGRARRCALAHDLDDHGASAMAFATCALVHAHVGAVDEARADLAAAQRLVPALAGAPPWFAAETAIVLARVHLRLSDAAAARDHLTDAGRLMRHCPDATVLRAALDDGWARADCFAEAASAGVAALTTAELRVLRMLPSHMSLGEIAGRLHVSLNTVKTQAHAVYRKLDATSRSEAVARARTVGLIDR